jgi:hypothetical protein
MKKKIHITGLVKFANRVRNELSQPVSYKKLIELRKEVKACLEVTNRILEETHSRIESLPAPSRKACRFLYNINFDSISPEETASIDELSPNSVSFPGLGSYFRHILDRLSAIDGTSSENEIFNSICSSSEHIEREIREQEIRPQHLKSQSRSIRGWLAYFAERQNFNLYTMAVKQAIPVFCEAAARARRNAMPIQIHFLPIKGLYNARSYKNQMLVKMPTPMICFDAAKVHLLAEWIFKKANNKHQIIAATLSDSYQEILSELDLLGGIAERTEGLHHNLAQSFERVNHTYFRGILNRPSLAWSRTFTYRKFGHYDQVQDKVVVSMSLDRKDVPEYVVDFIVYHELLHKKLGDRWSNGRRFSHTSEFYRQEKLFRQYDQSKAVLNKLAHPSG